MWLVRAMNLLYSRCHRRPRPMIIWRASIWKAINIRKKISNARASPSPVSQRKREESKRLSEQGCWFSSDPGELPARNAWSLSLTTPRLIEAWERAVKTVEWRLVYGFCDFVNHRQRSLSLQLMRCQWQLLDCRQRTVEVFEDESLIEFSSRPCITVIGLHFTWSL